MSIWIESDAGPPMQEIFTARTHAVTTDLGLMLTSAGRYLFAVSQKRLPALGSAMVAEWPWRLIGCYQASSPDLPRLAGPLLKAQQRKSAAP
jgi:UDP-N-acetyl-D-mannosaminuronic acid transferase (WecB/TagA/CpsF family)